MPATQSHARAVLQALFVTLLWSISFVLIKLGFQQEVPSLTFAGLRYSLAALVLLPVALSRPAHRAVIRRLSRLDWLRLAGLGLIFYTVTQSSAFVALERLPSATVSMFLNLSAITIALLGMAFLGERLGRVQWLGVIVSLVGAFVYLYPVVFPQAQWVGVLVVLIGMLSNSVSSVMGRYVNRGGALPPVVVTAISMSIGAAMMLGIALLAEGWPRLTAQSWLLIGVLAVVNTALAFTLWNGALRTLPAAEAGVINNTMLIQIAVLAWLFLGEALDGKAILGLALALGGTLLVQVRPRSARSVAAGYTD